METHTAEQSSQIVADIGLLLFITFSGLKYDIYIYGSASAAQNGI